MIAACRLLQRGEGRLLPLLDAQAACCARWTSAFSQVSTPAAAAGTSDASSAPPTQPVQQLPPPRPELVEQYLGTGVMARQELLKKRKQSIIEEFKRFPGDVGSTEVQVALLTDRIRALEPHFATHKHDFHSKRGMRALVNQRRSLLEYLRRTKFSNYCALITKLDLKDLFVKQKRLDRYRTGTALPFRTEPIKRYLYKK